MDFRRVDVRRLPRSYAKVAGAALALTLLLSGCGGGGGGGGGGGLPVGLLPVTTPPPAAGNGTDVPAGNGIVASSTVASLCAAPRGGVNPATNTAYPDRAGSLDNEKSWVRSWIDETYLWYSEVPTTLKASDYATPIAWFNVLKTPVTTPSGRAKDRFHFTYDTEVYRQLSQGGVSAGYGMETASIRSSPPRDIRIAYVEPNSPAASAGLARGAKILTIDGVDVVSATGSANVNAINNALSPKAVGESHSFTFDVGGTVQLAAANVTSTPVQNVRILTAGSARVGYLLFNEHITTSEALLVNAVNTFKQGPGIDDLVLDMRYNGGGQLLIASRLAYMISSPAVTGGKVFEQLVFNDKNPFRQTVAQTLTPFTATSRSGQPLPTLGLSRVTVLTGPDTCSASESVINSLRGVGVTVNLVGGTTCGKPYGFIPQDNCGTTYFAIQFKGANQQGYGDYSDGFAPTCTVADDFGHPLGDAGEARLAAALTLRSTGACPAGSTKAAAARLGLDKLQDSTPETESPYLTNRSPLRENRLLEPVSDPG